MNTENVLTVDGKTVPIDGERNLLELIRKCGIDIPTFCYHSELSVYGACRLCIVEIEGMGIVTSCSTVPKPGMVVRTNTPVLRKTRRMTLELLLADHDQNCATCPKTGACQLQALAKRFGVSEVRFKPSREPLPVDTSSPALVRNPNKCILCGDCVRACAEVQGIGALDFIGRGAKVTVGPAFNRMLDKVECVSCGQCARVCPTGAITPALQIEGVWNAIYDPEKVVVVQIAPAVRVALGEVFGEQPGVNTMGKAVAALRALGFDRVYDTSFTADLTVIEEANEFLRRFKVKENLPQFTSCCPAWVDLAERHFPDMLPLLSSCRSPQQMFGAVAKDRLPTELGIPRERLVVVSVMPCTAKKREAKLERFVHEGNPDVDFVLTTQELAAMIEELGLDFAALEPDAVDMPFGFKSGAGVIFGASGGVSEAVLRYVAEVVTGQKPEEYDVELVRGPEGIREAVVEVEGRPLRLAIVHGLANARAVVESIRRGKCAYDFIEVMACPGGCVGGAGQPVTRDATARAKRAKGLHHADKQSHFHAAQDNPFVRELYQEHLGEVGGKRAHELLHTHYVHRRRMEGMELKVHTGGHFDRIAVTVCVGTSCHLRGSQKILSGLTAYVAENNLGEHVDVKATFCFERCDRGPVVRVGNRILEHCTLEMVKEAIGKEVKAIKACYTVKPNVEGCPTGRDFERQTVAGLLRFLAGQAAEGQHMETVHGTPGNDA